jgi:hypothetical protein
MATKPRIRMNYGRTINMGNYESLRLDLSMEMDINEINDNREAFSFLQEELHHEMEKVIKKEMEFLGR